MPVAVLGTGLVVSNGLTCATLDPAAQPIARRVSAETWPLDGGAGEPMARAEWRKRKPGSIWGVTVDDVSPLEETVDALRSLPVRPTARIVFDLPERPARYVSAVSAIHQVSEVMGEILDSQFVAGVGVDAYRTRARDYLDALGGDVDVWEIGNEVNGDWLGPTQEVVTKMVAAYDEAKARDARTALTLHYEEGMLAWTEANVPPAMRDGLDLVLVSYYEDDCGGCRPEWPEVFHRLARIFPRAALGFGECGTARADAKEEQLRGIYGTRLDEPRFVGGFFWWYFTEDMVPKSRPLWGVLRGIMAGG